MSARPPVTTVLVVGGYGVFGRRAVERLARVDGLRIVIAGRSLSAARDLAAALRPTSRATLLAADMDAEKLTGANFREHDAAIVIHTAGPFQGQDYRVAQAAIEARAHYIDLADARTFATGITSLDAPARAADVLVVSGASSVPALAAAVIDHYLARHSEPTEITYGISPGNSFDPGEATVAAILGGAGRKIQTIIDGRARTVYGWQPLHRHRFRDKRIGTRWFGHCDVPDLDLFPQRYPSLKSQRFFAGVEVKAFHWGIWLLSWLVRLRLVPNAARLAKPLLAAKRHLRMLGSDRGVMFVELKSFGSGGQPLTTSWELIAEHDHGPYIPATPAVIVTKQLLNGTLCARGALPCVGLFGLEDFTQEIADLAIHQSDQ